MKNEISIQHTGKRTIKQKILAPDLNIAESTCLSVFLWWLGLSLVPLSVLLAIPTLVLACFYSKQCYDTHLSKVIQRFIGKQVD